MQEEMDHDVFNGDLHSSRAVEEEFGSAAHAVGEFERALLSLHNASAAIKKFFEHPKAPFQSKGLRDVAPWLDKVTQLTQLSTLKEVAATHPTAVVSSLLQLENSLRFYISSSVEVDRLKKQLNATPWPEASERVYCDFAFQRLDKCRMAVVHGIDAFDSVIDRYISGRLTEAGAMVDAAVASANGNGKVLDVKAPGLLAAPIEILMEIDKNLLGHPWILVERCVALARPFLDLAKEKGGSLSDRERVFFEARRCVEKYDDLQKRESVLQELGWGHDADTSVLQKLRAEIITLPWEYRLALKRYIWNGLKSQARGDADSLHS